MKTERTGKFIKGNLTVTVIAILLFVGLVGFSGCVSSQENIRKTLNTWIGAPKDALLSSWGMPTRTISMEGYEVWCYEGNFTHSSQGMIYLGSGLYGISPEYTFWRKVTFWIQDGIITSWRYEGNY